MTNTFVELLKKFEGCKTKEEYTALIEENKNARGMTDRQKSAIHDRCVNSINGVYGVSKRIEHMNHSKTN